MWTEIPKPLPDQSPQIDHVAQIINDVEEIIDTWTESIYESIGTVTTTYSTISKPTTVYNEISKPV